MIAFCPSIAPIAKLGSHGRTENWHQKNGTQKNSMLLVSDTRLQSQSLEAISFGSMDPSCLDFSMTKWSFKHRDCCHTWRRAKGLRPTMATSTLILSLSGRKVVFFTHLTLTVFGTHWWHVRRRSIGGWKILPFWGTHFIMMRQSIKLPFLQQRCSFKWVSIARMKDSLM